MGGGVASSRACDAVARRGHCDDDRSDRCRPVAVAVGLESFHEPHAGFRWARQSRHARRISHVPPRARDARRRRVPRPRGLAPRASLRRRPRRRASRRRDARRREGPERRPEGSTGQLRGGVRPRVRPRKDDEPSPQQDQLGGDERRRGQARRRALVAGHLGLGARGGSRCAGSTPSRKKTAGTRSTSSFARWD